MAQIVIEDLMLRVASLNHSARHVVSKIDHAVEALTERTAHGETGVAAVVADHEVNGAFQRLRQVALDFRSGVAAGVAALPPAIGTDLKLWIEDQEALNEALSRHNDALRANREGGYK